MDDVQIELVRAALRRAYIFGQNYWADADSESYAANRRATVTAQKFQDLIAETCAVLAAAPAQPTPPAIVKGSLEHAVDDQLVSYGRTLDSFATPHEAVQWLLEMERSVPTPPASEPLFLLHTGEIDSGGEQDEWDCEPDSGRRVEEFCFANPGKTIGLYPHPAPAQQEDARDAARYRWLRENNGSHLTKEPVQVSILRRFKDGEMYFVHAIHGLDAAIDAAMKEQA